ncbi:methylated-DNA--[protein]-cysteine S-methyltransferase [Nonlabens antarcticus]|uniref:methylated-DNA--[protein]-cysteine S-methyltransferase n=1 Tax=Nonlabens antarcticus TaxID=392714 RepID=UPI00189106DE|nr:methylated-DNA--[protein]-cysteine S-methyltransferase [Nonlabens antarcticus]
MSNIITTIYKSPVGEITLGVFEDKLCMCDWTYRKQREAVNKRIEVTCQAEMITGTHELIDQTIYQLDRYFTKEIQKFHLPILLCGTEFQKSVWNDLVEIPYGETMSYSSLSRKRKNPKSIRAVAAANGANALSIIVPCHRIIGADGALTGYAGGLRAKQALLDLEGIDLSHGQQSLF